MSKAPPGWLLEGLFIVLSVGLAFGVTEFKEARDNRALATRVLRSVKAEMEHNLADIEPYLAIHQRWAEALQKADTSKRTQNGLDVFMATRPALPQGAIAEFPTQVRRGAWDGALSTGALRLIDYEMVAALSQVYEDQKFYGECINRLASLFTSPAAFDPASRDLAARQLAVGMGQVAFAEQVLLKLYREHLPALRAATDAAE